MKCPICKASRSRLHTCVVCGEKRCGCCSYKSIINGKRTCSYPGDGRTCFQENREQALAARREAEQAQGAAQ